MEAFLGPKVPQIINKTGTSSLLNKTHRNSVNQLNALSHNLSLPLITRRDIPTEKLLLSLFSKWDVVCLCIHWVVQNTKQYPFLIHAGSVTLSAFFSFSFLQNGRKCAPVVDSSAAEMTE